MADCKEKLFAEFPPVSTQTWMDKVTADLKGADFEKKLVWRTDEGFNVKPMYRQEDIDELKTTDVLPGEFPYVRGTKIENEWLVRQNISVEDVAAANAKALEILNKGVNSLGFCINEATITAEGIEGLLKNISPEAVELNFNTCNKNAVILIETLAAYFASNNIDVTKVKGSINFDVFGRMMKNGQDMTDWTEKAMDVVKAAAALPEFEVLSVNAILLNNAGAYITQELGYALAWGNEILAKLTNVGLSVDEVAKRIKFNFGIGANFFMEIAKFRTARMLWAQIVAAYNPTCLCDAKMKIYAQTSDFNMTVFDAHVNLLRTQTEAMSATLAGVDSLTVNAFDKTFRQTDDFSERIARNQQLLLKEESHFDKIVDPSAGSYYIENLTSSIADQAWKLFLDIEDKDGFYAAVKAGFIQAQIKASNVARHKAVAQRREILLGSNQYPNFNETAASKIAKEGCNCGCNSAKENVIDTLTFNRASSDFEALRLSTEAAEKRPVVFMLTIGNLAMRLARAQFSANFFACAGYQIIDNLGFETIQSGVEAAEKASADIVVLCSSDEEYETLAPEAKNVLGNKAELVIAGAPACMDELKAKGIDQYINVRSNVLDTLKSFNAKLGIK